MRSSRLPLGPTLYESVGALHMHSLYSDGTGTVPEIARFAGQKGLEWIIITDHEHLKAKKNGEEGWYGKTAVLVGSELGDEDLPNHYLAFGIDKVPDQSDPVRMVEEVHAMGDSVLSLILMKNDTGSEICPPTPGQLGMLILTV